MNYIATLHYYNYDDRLFYNVKITYNELINIRDRIVRMRHNVINNERGLLQIAFEYPFYAITENITEPVFLKEEIYFYRDENEGEFDFIVELFK